MLAKVVRHTTFNKNFGYSVWEHLAKLILSHSYICTLWWYNNYNITGIALIETQIKKAFILGYSNVTLLYIDLDLI